MSSFEVKFSSLLVEQKNLNAVALQLTSISMQITEITARLSVKSSSISGVKKNLRSISSTTSEKSRNLKGMSTAVSDIAVAYRSAEQQITGYGGSMANILLAKNISSLLQYFADGNGVISNVFETLGSNGLFQLGDNNSVFSLFGKDGTLITSVDWNKWDVGNLSASGALLSILGKAEWGGISVENVLSIMKSEAEGKASANFDLKNMDIRAGVSGNYTFSVLEDRLKGSIGDYINGELSISALTGAIEAKAGCQIFKDNNFAPGLYAGIEGTAHGIKIDGSNTLGTDHYNIHSSAEGSLGYAQGQAEVGVGSLGDGEYGVKAEVGGKAYLAHGEAKSGITIMGIDINTEVSGGLGGAAFQGGASYTNKGMSLNGDLGLGAGIGLDITVDWTDFELPEFKLGELHDFPWN